MLKPTTIDLLEPSQEEEDRHLTAPEGEAPPELGPVTLTQVVDSLNARKYHESKIAEINTQADALIAPLQARIDQIKAWRDEQVADRERRIAFHDSRCIAYYRANPPKKDSKTLKLPGGKVSERSQDPEWNYGDEKALARFMDLANVPVVRKEPVLDKKALKEYAFHDKESGQWYIPNRNGEAIELPITVTERPAKFTVKVD